MKVLNKKNVLITDMRRFLYWIASVNMYSGIINFEE